VTTASGQAVDLIAVHRLLDDSQPRPTLARHELPYAARVLTAEGLSARTISVLLGVTQRTVIRWRKRPPAEMPSPPPVDWQRYAHCRAAGAALFFPDEDGAHSYSRARGVCAGCAVRAECLDDAMAREGDADHGGRAGLWGGLSPDQRAALALIRRGAVTR